MCFPLSGGQASYISYTQPLLDEVSIPSSQRGRPRKRCKWLLADKGYDAKALSRYCDQYRMQPVIPRRSMKRKPKPGLLRLFDRPKYRQRNIIERMFGRLKENSRIVTRFDKLAKKLCRNGLAGLFHMVFATSLFVQILGNAHRGSRHGLIVTGGCGYQRSIPGGLLHQSRGVNRTVSVFGARSWCFSRGLAEPKLKSGSHSGCASN